jgi:cell division septal protein FtsQ
MLFWVLIGCIYGLFILPGWYLREDAFSKPNGQTVEIVNNKIIPLNILYNSLREINVKHIPIFMMPVTDIKRELKKIPAIKEVYVRRYGFPARIQIIIRERIPMAVIKTELGKIPVAFTTTDNVMVTNKNFMHLAESDSTLRIIVKNPEFRKDWTVERVRYIDKIAKDVETYSGEKVRYVDMRNPNDVYVKIDSTTIRLGVLDSTVFDRIKRIHTILPELDKVNEKIKFVDLSWDKVNYLKLQSDKEIQNEKKEQDKKQQ